MKIAQKYLNLLIDMYLKYVNTVYFVFKYKIHFEFTSNTKCKIHRMHFKYVFEILIFEILYNSDNNNNNTNNNNNNNYTT